MRQEKHLLVCYVRVRRQSWFNKNLNSIVLLMRK